MDLSIVIVSYNTKEITSDCIQSILSTTHGVDFEIIVVDNASEDDSVQMIRTQFPSVKLICNQANRGFARAQNQGMLQSRGDYILILNSDILFVDNPMKRMLDFMKSDTSRIGATGPQVLNPDNTIAPSARRSIRSPLLLVAAIINEQFDYRRFLPESFLREYFGGILSRWHDNYSPHNTVQSVEYVDGMCVLCDRKALEEVGLFDEQFFLDAEIIDLSIRIRNKGWQIVFYPGSQVVHLGHVSRRKLSRAMVETQRSRLIFYSKYAPKQLPLLRRTTYIVVKLKLLLLQIKLRLASSKDRREELRQAIGLCNTLLTITREFDANSAVSNEKIPQLMSVM
jgi:GT2 family glycosyltransferase